MANNGGRQGGGGGGGGGGNGQMNEHVEFTVKAEEDLYLTGTENTIRRVTAETNYSCLMLKTQRFSSLFRHYAKYHGLRKDDLEYYFVNRLENEDTPEGVQLQRGDTIMVRKRRKPEPPEPAADDEEFIKDMRELLDDEEHMDAVFYVYPDSESPAPAAPSLGASAPTGASSFLASSLSVGASNKRAISVTGSDSFGDMDMDVKTASVPSTSDRAAASIKNPDSQNTNSTNHDDVNLIPIRAHKCILTARGEYFKALFRKALPGVAGNAPTIKSSNKGGSFRESTESAVYVESAFPDRIIRLMLEFIYTNRIQCLASSLDALSSIHHRYSPNNHTISTDDLLRLLHLSDKWVLRDLKRLVELELIRSHMDVNTVARMYCATEDYNARRLARACIDFIMENIREVTTNAAFQEDMKHYPHLCIPVLKAAAELIPEPAHKKARTGDHGPGSGAGAATTPGVGAGGGAGAMSSSPVPDSDP